MNNDYYAISVESRKGGVGKTTAALNLAKLFIDRGFPVLFLDADITGTNIGNAINSPFWKEVTNVIQEENANANLLEWFDRKFMCGKHIPDFAKKITPHKINLIGSQLFEAKKGKKEDLICSPSILFDKLHSFWFIECLKIICSSFVRYVKATSIIIIDNSPGFVGIAPAIHEWLTDMGPRHGKFLTVSSLDEQDIISCCHAVNNIHQTLLNKIETAKILENIQKDNVTIDKKYHAFLLRLLEECNYEKQNTKKSIKTLKELDFYLNKQVNKSEYLDNPYLYQNWIVNRVPLEVKRRIFRYNLDDILGGDSSFNRFLMKIWNPDDKYRDTIPQCQQVSYDEYIEYQFLHNLTFSTRRHERMHPRAEKMIHFLFEKLEHDIQNNIDNIFLDSKGFSYAHYKKIIEHSKNMQNYTEEVLERLERFGFSNLTRLIRSRKEWYPTYPIHMLRDTFYNMMLDSKYPPFEFLPLEYELGPVNKEAIENIEKLFGQLDKYPNENISIEVFYILKNSFLTAITLLFTTPFWHEPIYEMITKAFVGLFKMQLHHYIKRKGEKRTIQGFLAAEEMKEKELYEYEGKYFHFFEPSWKYDNYFVLFYKSLCQAQARFIDINKDVEFLIYILKEIIVRSKDELPLLPYIRPLLEKVIEKKTLSHEQGRKQCAKGFQEANYMEEFQDVLTGVIDKWGIKRNGI